MAGTIISTQYPTPYTATAYDNAGEQCGLIHVSYLVPATPSTSITLTIANSGQLGIRAIPDCSVSTVVVSGNSTVATKVAVQDYTLTYNSQTASVTITNGTTFALTQSQLINLLIVTQPIGS